MSGGEVKPGFDLAGKRVIVAGGSRGIGLSAVRAFLAEGAAVGILSRDPDTVVKRLAESGPSASGSQVQVAGRAADIRDREATASAVHGLVEELGGVDVLVNTAVTSNVLTPEGPVSAFDAEELQLGIDVKVFGYLNTIAAVAPLLIEQKWGRIINTGASSIRLTGSRSRSARNAALSALSRNLSDELGAHGITVNVVHPGFTATERFDDAVRLLAEARGVADAEAVRSLRERTSIGRVPTADEVASAIVFLASPRASAITGAALDVGGGVRGAISGL